MYVLILNRQYIYLVVNLKGTPDTAFSFFLHRFPKVIQDTSFQSTVFD
jgi:hypothetical protein